MEQLIIDSLRQIATNFRNGKEICFAPEFLENCANLIEFQFNHINELNKVIGEIEKQLDSVNEP